MKTKKLIVDTFLKDLNERELNKITITALCKECSINRNTFYYYFDDIYSVLTEVFRSHVEKVVNEIDATQGFAQSFEKAISLVIENKVAINHVYDSLKREALEEYLFAVSKVVVQSYVLQKTHCKSVLEEDVDLIIYFYQCALTEMMMQWIKHGLHGKASERIYRLAFLMDGHVEQCLKKALIGKAQEVVS